MTNISIHNEKWNYLADKKIVIRCIISKIIRKIYIKKQVIPRKNFFVFLKDELGNGPQLLL